MKLSQERIQSLSRAVVRRLSAGQFAEIKGEPAAVARKVAQVITDELLLEEQLNQEVERILKAYDAEFEAGRVDYHKMFQMTKKQLARDRGIIL